MDKQPHWLNKSDMAASLGISVQAFDKWGIKPVARIGREAFFDVRAVLDNRLEHAARKYAPAGDDEEGLDPLADKKLTQERLRLTAAQADAQELKNSVKRAQLVPVGFAVFALSRMAAQIGSLLDTVPLKLRRKHPDLDVRHVEALQREIALARNTAADLGDTLPDMLDEYLDTLDDTAGQGG
ncbi:terminase small subunit [Azotobacter beijerinckii]|uniref:Phage DNA packaging protein, Nu1 subunit of terminase n=1 Tax=Azotobacter beijerinckii TaxID=170623 RepID=A0A1I4GBI9_9GAMM|nr:terminase small subunit [Azotobacter beijerinckii]SFB46389.1 Phage DNA packaging protein, Nu1 subunit of terminase [Azotobacter beijerinckii]SFL26880.1 Phage DNA packaging protein, Nu1 subunit of terminase [Azotobacter beijerinckii]